MAEPVKPVALEDLVAGRSSTVWRRCLSAKNHQRGELSSRPYCRLTPHNTRMPYGLQEMVVESYCVSKTLCTTAHKSMRAFCSFILLRLIRLISTSSSRGRSAHRRWRCWPSDATAAHLTVVACGPANSCSRVSSSTGLTMWKLKPASCERSRSSSCPQPVNATRIIFRPHGC